MDELTLIEFATLIERDPRTVKRWRAKGIIKEYSYNELAKLKNGDYFTKNGNIKKIEDLPENWDAPLMRTMTERDWNKLFKLLKKMGAKFEDVDDEDYEE